MGGANLHIGWEQTCRMSYEFLHFTHNSVCFLPRMHCTKMASSDKTTLKKKPRTLAEKGKNRFLGNDKKGGQGGVGPLGVGLGGGAEP